VYHNPKYVEVGEYFSYPTMNIFEAEIAEENGAHYLKVTDQFKIKIDKIAGQLSKSSYYIGIHAHAVSIKQEKEEMVPIEGKVVLAEAVGSDTELHVDHQGHTMIVLMQDIVTYEAGQKVDLYVNPYRFYIFDKETRELCAKTMQE